MASTFESRGSDSAYIEAVWRDHAGRNYAPICPASNHWHLLFMKRDGKPIVSIEGPLTRSKSVRQDEGVEWFGVTFKLGTFLTVVPASDLRDVQTILPLNIKTTFELAGSRWQLPDYDNVETFVHQLVREHLLIVDPLVKAVLAGQQPEVSERTVRRRFLHATGLAPKTIEQINRANQAAVLLAQGVSLLEATYQAGYADQPHMTRSLKHFIGYTPAQIAQTRTVE
ncbi:hypothetical protein KDA_04560 [Dictyobacter alpinus]|uniref:HTH araC/xylS-type domain-containing protein n=1 Tax=Dictyobacter alpinus TaxID=2014873 RepID=A0A402B0V6_9CHLR|nr:AraC family transcriptional regulator [Dictyobacter alpinus]GCE24972.1 hypothetical protein KDA_04560 [Dictyobacter alpinus]